MKIIKCWNHKLADGEKLIKYLCGLFIALTSPHSEIEELLSAQAAASVVGENKRDGKKYLIFQERENSRHRMPKLKLKASSLRRAFEWLMLMGMRRCLHICRLFSLSPSPPCTSKTDSSSRQTRLLLLCMMTLRIIANLLTELSFSFKAGDDASFVMPCQAELNVSSIIQRSTGCSQHLFSRPFQTTRGKFTESHPIAKIRPIDGCLQMNASQSAVRRLNCRRETGERGSKIVVQLLKVSERRRKKNIAKTFPLDQLRARLRDVQVVSDLRQSSSGIMKVSFVIVCFALFIQSSKFVIDARLDFIRNILTQRLSALQIVRGDWRSRSAPFTQSTEICERKASDECNRHEFVARLFYT